MVVTRRHLADTWDREADMAMARSEVDVTHAGSDVAEWWRTRGQPRRLKSMATTTQRRRTAVKEGHRRCAYALAKPSLDLDAAIKIGEEVNGGKGDSEARVDG